jgi:hypothetical protein
MTEPFTLFQYSIALGVGFTLTLHFFLRKYATASSESRTMPSWPEPMISRSAPS